MGTRLERRRKERGKLPFAWLMVSQADWWNRSTALRAWGTSPQLSATSVFHET